MCYWRNIQPLMCYTWLIGCSVSSRFVHWQATTKKSSWCPMWKVYHTILCCLLLLSWGNGNTTGVERMAKWARWPLASFPGPVRKIRAGPGDEARWPHLATFQNCCVCKYGRHLAGMIYTTETMNFAKLSMYTVQTIGLLQPYFGHLSCIPVV